MAGMAVPELTLTRDRATKTVHTVATCRILFNEFELRAMEEEGLRFRLRAKLLGADVLTKDDILFLFPPKIYPDATPDSIEEARFEETLAEEVLDESVILTDRIFARFELTNLRTQDNTLQQDSPEVVGRF